MHQHQENIATIGIKRKVVASAVISPPSKTRPNRIIVSDPGPRQKAACVPQGRRGRVATASLIESYIPTILTK